MYSGSSIISIPNGFHGASLRYQPSAPFDVDPLLGSTASPGFSELAAIYASCRSIESTLDCEMTPVAQTGLVPTAFQGVVVPLNVDPGSTPLVTSIESWTSNPYRLYKMLAQAGGPTTKFKTRMSTEKIYGTKMVWFDDNFASLTSGIPNNNWFWGIGVLSDTNSATLPYQVAVRVSISMVVEFYDRKILSN